MFNSKTWSLSLRHLVMSYWHMNLYLGDKYAQEAYIESKKIKLTIDDPNTIQLLDLPDYDRYKERLHKTMEFSETYKDTLAGNRYSRIFSDFLGEDLTMENDEFKSLHYVRLSPDFIIRYLPLAKNLFNQQMVIAIAVFIEQILIEFVTDFFVRQPHRMYTLLGNGNKKTGLEESIAKLKSELNDESIPKTAKLAANYLLTGPISARIEHLNQLAENKISEAVEKELIALFDLRDRITQEVFDIVVSVAYVGNIFDLCENFIAELCK